MSKDVLRIGIVGSGGRGTYCFGQMLSQRTDAAVVALADPNPVRMRAAQQILGVTCACYATPDAMLGAERLDGAIVTSPDHAHEACALAAIRHGVHVLVDKPLATTAAGCMNVIRAATKAKLEVAVGFNLRHAPVLRRVKELIDNGEVGEVMLIENREFYSGGRTYMSRWNRRSELSGGLWIHKGSHDFDILNWWNPKGTPIRVSAFGGLNALRADRIPFAVEPGKAVGPSCSRCAYAERCPDRYAPEAAGLFTEEAERADGYVKDLCMFLSDKDTHDNGIAMVEYDNNVRASHMECFVCGFSDRLYTVVGDRGTLTASLHHPKTVELRPRWKDAPRTIDVPPPPEGGHGGADPGLLDNFLASIRTGAGTTSTARDGIRAVAVGQAAELSWRQHRTVNISDIVDLYDTVLR